MLPTDGYTPTQVTYTVRHTSVIVDDLALTVHLASVGPMSLEAVDDAVRRHIEALYAEIIEQGGDGALVLTRSYQGARTEDINPQPEPPVLEVRA